MNYSRKMRETGLFYRRRDKILQQWSENDMSSNLSTSIPLAPGKNKKNIFLHMHICLFICFYSNRIICRLREWFHGQQIIRWRRRRDGRWCPRKRKWRLDWRDSYGPKYQYWHAHRIRRYDLAWLFALLGTQKSRISFIYRHAAEHFSC